VQALEDSLRRLRLEQIPVYQVHWPDPSTPIDETLDALRRCQEQGKIGFIGVSNFSLKLLQQASELHRIECAQVPYNLLSREIEQDILPWCAANQVGILAHSGLARGLFSGKRPLGTVFQDRDTRARSPYFSEEGRAEKQRLLDAIGEICERTGRTRACVALRWVLDHSEITSVLVGIKDRAQLEENVGASEWHLSSSDFELLARHSSACPNGLAGQPAHAARS
jgi:aryl-alcohol dehydrogenase-like predicted oxidoreductase